MQRSGPDYSLAAAARAGSGSPVGNRQRLCTAAAGKDRSGQTEADGSVERERGASPPGIDGRITDVAVSPSASDRVASRRGLRPYIRPRIENGPLTWPVFFWLFVLQEL